MNARLEPKKDPADAGDRGQAQRADLDQHGQAAARSEAIAFLQNYTGLNIVLDPKALDDEGVTSASPVTLAVNNIRLKTVLKLMLKPLGLTYKVEDEVLLITSPQATQSHDDLARPYYVGDLVMPPDKRRSNLLPVDESRPTPQPDPTQPGRARRRPSPMPQRHAVG